MDCYYTAIYFKFIEAGYDAFIDYANKMHFLLNISSLISSKDFFSLDSKQYFFGNRSSVSRNRWSQSNPAIAIFKMAADIIMTSYRAIVLLKSYFLHKNRLEIFITRPIVILALKMDTHKTNFDFKKKKKF